MKLYVIRHGQTNCNKENRYNCRYDEDINQTGIRMETWDFQARGFYEKNGYNVFGEIKDCPPGTICYFLKKEC